MYTYRSSLKALADDKQVELCCNDLINLVFMQMSKTSYHSFKKKSSILEVGKEHREQTD